MVKQTTRQSNTAHPRQSFFLGAASGGTRTHDTLHSRQSALPLSYQSIIAGWAKISYLIVHPMNRLIIMNMYMYIAHEMAYGYETCTCESHLRQLIFSRKSDCLGCAVLLCLVCLFDLACFFLSSFSSLI